MAWMQDFPGAAAMGENAERALRLPIGVASPLWGLFGAAATTGMAYWWMTAWTRAVNVEALAGLVPAPPKLAIAAPPVEIIAEPAPEPAAEAVAEPEPAVEAEPSPARAADDLTRLTGVGPKLSVALAERGVTRFAQIAAWTEKDLAEVDQALSLKGRAVREAWVAQAKRLTSA